MSTLAYASLTRRRELSPARESRDASPPGVRTYVDTLAALVPAEVLALHAFLLSLGAETEPSGDATTTTITDSSTLRTFFIVLTVGAAVLYLLGKVTAGARSGGRAGFEWLDVIRALVPAAAFVGWTMVQKATMFDAVAPDMGELARVGTAAVAAIVLGAVAAALAIKADRETPAT